MKNSKIIITAMMAMAIAGATSCQDDAEDLIQQQEQQQIVPESQPSSKTHIKFTASCGDASQSLQKTLYKDGDPSKNDGTIVWDIEDDFGVDIFPIISGSVLDLGFGALENKDGSACDIDSYAGEGDEYFAIYPPYPQGSGLPEHVCDQDGKITGLSIPAQQNVEAGQYDPEADIMTAYATNAEKNFAFRHVGAKLGITIPEGLTGIKNIEITCSEYIAGVLEITQPKNTSDAPTAKIVRNASKTITLNGGFTGFTAGNTYYACVFPTSGNCKIWVTFYTNTSADAGYLCKGQIGAMNRATRNLAQPPSAKCHQMAGISGSTGNLQNYYKNNIQGNAQKIVFDYLTAYSSEIGVSLTEETGVFDSESPIHLYKGSDNDYYILSDCEMVADDGFAYSMMGGTWFAKCSYLQSVVLKNFNTQNWTSMTILFKGLKNLEVADLSGISTDNVTDMTYMFENCNKLSTLTLPDNPNTGNVTDMKYMFHNCAGLASLDLSKFNTGNVTNMKSMFDCCSALSTLDVSNFSTAKVTDMTQMFYNCNKIGTLDLSSFNTASVKKMDAMFAECGTLSTIYASVGFVGVGTNNMMFYNCASLSGYTSSNTGADYAQIGNGGYFTAKP